VKAAGRFRFSNVLHQAVRSRIAGEEEEEGFFDVL
jgi:hypothetical protein